MMKTDLLISPSILYWLVLFGIIFTVFSVSFDLTSFGISLEKGKYYHMLRYCAILLSLSFLLLMFLKTKILPDFYGH